jgi:hypothetical protein
VCVCGGGGRGEITSASVPVVWKPASASAGTVEATWQVLYFGASDRITIKWCDRLNRQEIFSAV